MNTFHRKNNFIYVAFAVLIIFGIAAAAQGELLKVGPVVPVTVGGTPIQNGFPLWYQDQEIAAGGLTSRTLSRYGR